MRLGTLFATLLCVACSEQSAQRSSPAEPSRLSCDGRVSAFEARLALAPPDLGAFMQPPPGVRVIQGHGEPVPSLGPVVTIDRDDVMLFDGEPILQPALQPHLDQWRRNWSLLHPRRPFPGRFFAWIDADVKVQDARSLLQSDHTWLLLVEDPSLRAEPPTCPTSLGEGRCQQFVGPADHVARLRVTRELWSRGVGGCQELVTMFDSIAQASFGEKSAILRREMPIALRQCECNADVDILEYVALTILSLGAPVIRAVQVDEGASADETIGEYVQRVSAR